MILVWRGLYLSIALHLLLLSLLALIPKPVRQENVSIEFITPESSPTKKSRQIVRDQLLPEHLQTEHSLDPLRFLSAKTQSVKEQIRALQTGMTKNRALKSVSKKSPQKITELLPDRNSLSSLQKDLAENRQRELESGVSTFGNDLPMDIKVGNITALNTERYLFYSYFARAEELLRHEWEPMITTILKRPPASMQTSVQRTFTTVLEVWFHPSGQVHSTHLMKPSGVQELDQIAAHSFAKVKMIPNPPKERIEKDGLVRFQWSLVVEYNPKVLVRQ